MLLLNVAAKTFCSCFCLYLCCLKFFLSTVNMFYKLSRKQTNKEYYRSVINLNFLIPDRGVTNKAIKCKHL